MAIYEMAELNSVSDITLAERLTHHVVRTPLLLQATTMSSVSSTTLPSPAELENLGVLFVGFVITTVFYGLTFFRMFSHPTVSPAA